ncbi:MAG: aquaporin [Chloroflexi bacterium]|nr:aquaporin [Chloroflexota bacterium]
MIELLSGNNLRGLAAELIATFMFVFMGIGAVGAATTAGLSLLPLDASGLIIIALGHGLGIFIGIVAIARITGAHLNPAVTISAIVSGNLGVIRGVSYIIGQLLGSIIAVFLLELFVWTTPEAEGLGAHTLTISANEGLVIEFILTFFLVFTVFATAIDKRGNAAFAPLAIGLVVFVDHLIAVPLTGASMNPARTLGPALIHGIWDDHWVYWVGPIVGGIAATLTYVLLFGSKNDRDRLGTLNIGSDEVN